MNRRILKPDVPPKRIDDAALAARDVFIVVAFVLAIGWLAWMLQDEASPELMEHFEIQRDYEDYRKEVGTWL